MSIKLTKDLIVQANAVIEALHVHIKDYLQQLQEAEAAIICVDDDIAAGRYNCFHYRPSGLFHHRHDYAPYSKAELDYVIHEFMERGIKLTVCYTELIVPYMYSEVAFMRQCVVLFEQERKDMAHCLKVKAEAVADEAVKALEDKRLRAAHHHGDYTYRWTNCTHCNNGHVYVGTGVWEDDPFSDGRREVTRTEYCPKCQGSEGLLVYSRCGGPDKFTACSKSRFKDHEDDLLALFVEN